MEDRGCYLIGNKFLEEEREALSIDPNIEIRVLACRELVVGGKLVYKKDKNGKIVRCDIRIDEDADVKEAEDTARHELKHMKQRCQGLDASSMACEIEAYLYEKKRRIGDIFGYFKKAVSQL